MSNAETETGSHDRISLAPPPKRSLPDMSGFTTAPSSVAAEVADAPVVTTVSPAEKTTTAAAPASRKSRRAPSKKAVQRSDSPPQPSDSPPSSAKKTTLHLSPSTVRKLKLWKEGERRTTADAVMSAYISCRADIAKDFAMTDEDKERAAYGLAPLATTARPGNNDADEGTRVVGIYINVRALEDLDTTASELGLSRSRFADALLRTFLDDVES